MSSITTCDFNKCKENPSMRVIIFSRKRDKRYDFCDSHLEEIIDFVEEKNKTKDTQDL